MKVEGGDLFVVKMMGKGGNLEEKEEKKGEDGSYHPDQRRTETRMRKGESIGPFGLT